MKKWLLAIMVCLSFASLTAGLILLPQTINAVYQRQEEENKDKESEGEYIPDELTGYNWASTYAVRTITLSKGSYTTSNSPTTQIYANSLSDVRHTIKNGMSMLIGDTVHYSKISLSGITSRTTTAWNSDTSWIMPKVSGMNFLGYYQYLWGGTQYINSSGSIVNSPVSYGTGGSTTWYARFETIPTYTITYDYNGGTYNNASSTTQIVYKDGTYSSYTTPPSPTRAGYTLKGWSVNLATTISGSAVSSTRWESGALSVTQGHYYTLAAMWYNGTKYVSLKTRGFIVNGSDVKTGKYEVGSDVSSLKAYVNVSSATSASEINEKLRVTIREMDSSGSIDYIQASQLASTKIKVNKSHTLIANWTTGEVPYAIYLNEGSHAGSAATQTNITYGQKVPSLPTPSVDSGYTFSGWYTTNSTSGGKKVSAGDTFNENSIGGTWDHSAHTLTLYSRATPAYYTITLNTNSGTGGSSSVYAQYLSSSLYSNTSGSTTTPSAPSRTGYTFGGWTVTKDGTDVLISSSGVLQDDVYKGSDYYTYEIVSGTGHNAWAYTGNVTAYAKWTAKKYAITLDVNGATSGSNKTIYAQYNSSSLYANGTQGNTSVASITNPTRANYNFKGWSTSSSLGSGTIIINTGKNLVESTEYTNSAKNWTKDTDSTITLYACWEPVARTVKVNLRKVTTTGSASSGWDNATPFYVNYTKATATSTSVENTSSTVNANYEAWQDSVMTFQATFNGAIFLGVTASDSAPTTAPHTMGVSTYTVGTGATQNIYLWMQEISTPLRLANDERGWWWYLEDGVFPQSYVGDSLNNTLNSAGLTSSTTYNFGAGQTINVYTYSGSQYAKVAGNGTTIKLNGGATQTFASGTNYWFKVEPIKWRVSKFYADYSTAIDAYPNISYSNVYGVSDMLGYGYMTTGSTAAGTAVSSFAGATLSYAGLGFGDTSTMSIGNEKYSADLSSVKVTWQTRNASQSNTLNVADAYQTISGALMGVTYTKYATSDNIPSAGTFNDKFYASDLSAMKMGMSYNNARAWTTDLYNLGSGYTILSSGSMQTSYLNENYGYIFAHKVAMASNCGMEYKAMNYIQSSGSQRIDTGVNQTNKATVDCKFYTESHNSNYIFGDKQNNSMIYNGLYNYNSLEYNWQALYFTANSTIVMTQRISGNNTQILINEAYFEVATGTTATDNRIYIFACNGGNRYYAGNTRCYYFRMYDNNTLVRDFAPVQNLKTGEYGLFDKVTKTFYGNSGSGAFTGA